MIGVLTLALSFLMGPMIPSASAKGISIPSPSQVASELENRYHINVGSVQNQSELFNVANQKKTVPEVSLFFSPSGPKSGQKITASALPSFFANEKENLYFSWYLKRKDCDIDGSPSSAIRAKCDADNNGRINANDWKVEAMRTLVSNGFDNSETSYGSDSDNDGYKARFGGDNKVGVANRCATYDSASGNIYEIGKSSSLLMDVCASGLTPVCMTPRDEVTAGSFTSGDGSPFTVSTSTTCDLSGYPSCSSGTVTCSSGELTCVAEPYATSCGSSATSTSCSVTSSGGFTNECQHLFPQVSGETSGDGSFGTDEERFWGTSPSDPDTADNNNKDEANIVGLGQDTFSWTYDSGDKVGLAVEGTSMVTTKHDDSSAYVMWAFSKNNCPISIAKNTGSYAESIRGYSVSFPTAEVNLNDCLERNLIDPVEGGQPNRIEVSVVASPENPVNDESGDLAGDIVTASAMPTNTTGGSERELFDWTVSIANNIQFDNSGSGRRSNDVTDELKEEKLLNFTRGNGLSSLSLPMNMPSSWESGLRLADYVNSDGIGYLRFAVTVSENFATDVARKGRGDVIVKFQTISDRIGAYKATAAKETLKLSFQNSDEICNDNLFRRAICPVVKNEIVGLKVGSSGFTDYRWTVNGRPLLCSDKLSSQCAADTSTGVTFLPIFGETNDTFTVSVDATDIVSGKSATLSRIFRIVDPAVEIISADTNQTWPKFLGQYRDASGKLYSDLSRNIFQAFGSGSLRLKASFMPPFLQGGASGAWTINGEAVALNADGEIALPIDSAASSIYNVAFEASTIQSPEIRQALQTHWNISVFDSGEEYFSKSVQVEVVEGEDDEVITTGFLPGSKSFAALASYVPASVLFMIKAFFSMALVLLLSGFMMAIIPGASLRRSRE